MSAQRATGKALPASADYTAREIDKSRYSYGHRNSNLSSELQDRIDDLARIGEDEDEQEKLNP